MLVLLLDSWLWRLVDCRASVFQERFDGERLRAWQGLEKLQVILYNRLACTKVLWQVACVERGIDRSYSVRRGGSTYDSSWGFIENEGGGIRIKYSKPVHSHSHLYKD